MGASESKSSSSHHSKQRRGGPTNASSPSSSSAGGGAVPPTTLTPSPPRLPGRVSIVGIPSTHTVLERLHVYAPRLLASLQARHAGGSSCGSGRSAVGGANGDVGGGDDADDDAIDYDEEIDEFLTAIASIPRAELVAALLGNGGDNTTAAASPPFSPPSPSTAAASPKIISDDSVRILLSNLADLAEALVKNKMPSSSSSSAASSIYKKAVGAVEGYLLREALLLRTVNTPQSLLDQLAAQMSFVSSSNTHCSGTANNNTSTHTKKKGAAGGNAAPSSSSSGPPPVNIKVGSPIMGDDNGNTTTTTSDGSAAAAWYLLFSTKYHGRSYNKLVSATCQRGPTVTIIEVAPEGGGDQQYHTVTVGSDDLATPYWREEVSSRSGGNNNSGGQSDNNTYYSDYYGGNNNNNNGNGSPSSPPPSRQSVDASVFIGGFNMCNWLNNAQREKVSRRDASAAANSNNAGGGGGFSSPSSGGAAYATGALSFLNNNNNSSAVDATACTDPAAVAGIFSPTTNPSYAPSVPYGQQQHGLFSGNSNCWLFRADSYCSSSTTANKTNSSSNCVSGGGGDDETIAEEVDRNFGYFNGRGDYSMKTANLRLFRPTTATTTTSSSSSAARKKQQSSCYNANYQYLVDQHPVDADMVGIGMGGSVGSWAWFIDKWLEKGSCNVVEGRSTGGGSGGGGARYGGGGGGDDDDDDDPYRIRRCPTFNSLLLAPWQRWRVVSVEVFAVDPMAVEHYTAVDAVNAEAARRADDPYGNNAQTRAAAKKKRGAKGVSSSSPSSPPPSATAATTSSSSTSSLLPPLTMAPIATTPNGEFISRIIGAAFGDLNLAFERNFDDLTFNATSSAAAAKRGGTLGGGVLHGDGAAADKMILELNQTNEFREDVVQDDKFDYTRGCGMGDNK